MGHPLGRILFDHFLLQRAKVPHYAERVDGSVERIGLADVWVVPAGGGDAQKLDETPDRRASLLAWAGDGMAVYVSESIGTTRQVFSVPGRRA